MATLSQSLQPVLEAVGVYADRSFNEVGPSLHTLVKESLSVCSPAASSPSPHITHLPQRLFMNCKCSCPERMPCSRAEKFPFHLEAQAKRLKITL